VGEVTFAMGKVRANAGAGESRPLLRGDAVDEAETVSTGARSRVQLRFKDGALVTLQPQSSLRVDRYRHVGTGDSEDSVGLTFLKGGLRALSGIVGKKNPKAYRMNSPVATIGIRGTDYSLFLTRRLLGRVNAGAIDVCNAGGCLTVKSGEAFAVNARDEAPARYFERLEVPGRAGWQPFWQGRAWEFQAGRPGASTIRPAASSGAAHPEA